MYPQKVVVQTTTTRVSGDPVTRIFDNTMGAIFGPPARTTTTYSTAGPVYPAQTTTTYTTAGPVMYPAQTTTTYTSGPIAVNTVSPSVVYAAPVVYPTTTTYTTTYPAGVAYGQPAPVTTQIFTTPAGKSCRNCRTFTPGMQATFCQHCGHKLY